MDEARRLIEKLQAEGKTIALAESCTGGLLGKLLTDVPGASSVFLGGIVSYAYSLKEQLLGIPHALLEEKGAVCEEVALSMAASARERIKSDIALSITGNAGPGADGKNPNIGEIYIAYADEYGSICKKLQLNGTREENRTESCRVALELALNH